MDDDDFDFTTDIEVSAAVPERFQKAVLFGPPLLIVRSVAEGVRASCDLLIEALDSHMAFDAGQRDFHIAAAREIEALIEGESE